MMKLLTTRPSYGCMPGMRTSTRRGLSFGVLASGSPRAGRSATQTEIPRADSPSGPLFVRCTGMPGPYVLKMRTTRMSRLCCLCCPKESARQGDSQPHVGKRAGARRECVAEDGSRGGGEQILLGRTGSPPPPPAAAPTRGARGARLLFRTKTDSLRVKILQYHWSLFPHLLRI